MKYRVLIIFMIFASQRVIAQGQSTYADSLLQIVSLRKHDDAEMKALLLLAIDCHRANPDKGKAYLNRMVTMASDADNYNRQCGAYSLLLSIYQEEGNIDSTLYCVNKLKGVAIKAPDNNKVQTNFNQSMGRYLKRNGDYKAALPYTLNAAKLAEESGVDKTNTAGQWLNAGDVYESLGDYNNAMTCTLKALRFFEQAGNRLGESFCYTNISAIYIHLMQYNKALKYAKKSLQLKKTIGDKRSICTSLEAVGDAYIGKNNLPLALDNYKAALKIAIDEKMPEQEATCYFTMGKIFAAQHEDVLAASHFKKSKTIAAQIDNELMVANAEMALLALRDTTVNMRQTESSLLEGLQTFKEAGSREKEIATYKQLSELYAANKQYDKALRFANKFHVLKDSMAGIDIQLQLSRLEGKYNSDKKEQEILLLRKDQELQRQKLSRQRILFGAAAALLALSLLGIVLLINRNRIRQRMKELEMRNEIAAELHDEVGSSLSSIHMLSQMAEAQQRDSALKNDLLTRISSNSRETMDRMGDIVWMIKRDDTGSGNMAKRMESFAYEICGSKNIEVHLDVEEMEKPKLSMTQCKNIYLIFKEALNNAVKYSGTKKIAVKARLCGQQLSLTIKDWGKGYDKNHVKKGNGLDNMKNRANELKGILLINTSPAGTIVQLDLPV